MKKLVPKHPRTDEFVAQGLYAVNSFKELEVKISALETKDERGVAFEVFAEAFLVTQEGIDPDHYWPQGKIPLVVQENLGLPRNDFGIDSVYLKPDPAIRCLSVQVPDWSTDSRLGRTRNLRRLGQ
jgi:hypothetical protein